MVAACDPAPGEKHAVERAQSNKSLFETRSGSRRLSLAQSIVRNSGEFRYS
jgi:hypothetical protein